MAAPMEKPRHHVKSEYCTTRPIYREGRQLKAVKVYTINDESQYLLVQGIPAVGTHSELLKIFSLYGEVAEDKLLKDYPAEEFCDTLLVKFKRIQSARYAKKKVDDTNFYGGVLHICYAPEFETVQETRDKLRERRQTVAIRIKKLDAEKREFENTLQQSLTEGAEENEVEEEHQDDTEGKISDGVMDKEHTTPTSSYAFVDHGQMVDRSPFHQRPPLPPLPLPVGMPGWFPQRHNIEPFHRYPVPRQYLPRSHGPFHTEEQFHKYRPENHNATHSIRQNRLSSQDWSTALTKTGLNIQPSHVNDAENNAKTSAGNNENSFSKVIVKKNDSQKALGKLIPRQVSKKKVLPEGLLGKVTQSTRDSVNEELRKQAFVLGAVKGPSKPNCEEMSLKQKSAVVDQAMDNTVLNIRKRVQEFAAVAPPRQIKKSKKDKSS